MFSDGPALPGLGLPQSDEQRQEGELHLTRPNRIGAQRRDLPDKDCSGKGGPPVPWFSSSGQPRRLAGTSVECVGIDFQVRVSHWGIWFMLIAGPLTGASVILV